MGTTPPTAPLSVPVSLALILAGGGLLGWWRRRRKPPELRGRLPINAQIAVPLSGSCSQIKQGCAGCCPDCKQNQNCPCSRASSCCEPWSRFALGLLFAWFEISFDPFQALIECNYLQSLGGACRRGLSLISIPLGLLTVIGASFRSLPLKRRQDNGSNAN